MRETNAFEKLITSAFNVGIVFAFFVPFALLPVSFLAKKIIFVLLFFIYNLIVLYVNEGRCVGMIIMNTHYKEEHTRFEMFLYNLFYSISFATLLFYLFFPFDILLFNLLFLQLPTVLLTKTTLHGFLAGGVTTVKHTAKQ